MVYLFSIMSGAFGNSSGKSDQFFWGVEEPGSCFTHVCFLGGITPCLGSAVTINRVPLMASPCSLGLLKNDAQYPKESIWRRNSQRVSGLRPRKKLQGSTDLASEVIRCPFCHILLGSRVAKASPHSKGRERDSTT